MRDNLDDHAQPLILGYNQARRLDRAVHELLGLLKGILIDGVVSPDEVVELGRWILRNREAVDVWPVSVVVERVNRAMADRVIDPEECADLQELFTSLTDPKGTEHMLENPATRLPLTVPPPRVVFTGQVYVFTGKFLYGTRRALEKVVDDRGGICEDTVTRRTNYLVLGTVGSRDWVHSSFGRKIQYAAELAAAGHPVRIISEEHWTAAFGRCRFRVGDQVEIRCPASKYNGVAGVVFEIEERSGYVMIDMPRGTEWKAEKIEENAILKEWRAADKINKTPRTRWPDGEPQRFPVEWLVAAAKADSAKA